MSSWMFNFVQNIILFAIKLYVFAFILWLPDRRNKKCAKRTIYAWFCSKQEKCGFYGGLIV